MSIQVPTHRLSMRVLAFSLVSVFPAGSALGQDQTPAGGQAVSHRGDAFRSACAADLQTYCATAQSRDERHQCMTANHDKLSDTCRTFLDSRAHTGQGH